MNRYMPLCAIFLVLLLVGCSSTHFGRIPDVGSAVSTVSDAGRHIAADAHQIGATASDGVKVAPDLPHWSIITAKAASILAHTVRLADSAAALGAAQRQIEAAAKRCAELERRDAAATRRTWTLFGVGGALGVVAGVVVLVVSQGRAVLLGLAVMAGGAAAVALGAFVPQLTGWWFILLMIAIACAVVAALVWTLWRARDKERAEAGRAAALLHDALKRAKPLEAAIASLRTSWQAFDLAWRSR